MAGSRSIFAKKIKWPAVCNFLKPVTNQLLVRQTCTAGNRVSADVFAGRYF